MAGYQGCRAVGMWMAALLSMFVVLFAVVEIVLETQLQHAIESHARATVTSVVNMAREIVGMLITC